jgi:hypothetical protein
VVLIKREHLQGDKDGIGKFLEFRSLSGVGHVFENQTGQMKRGPDGGHQFRVMESIDIQPAAGRSGSRGGEALHVPDRNVIQGGCRILDFPQTGFFDFLGPDEDRGSGRTPHLLVSFFEKSGHVSPPKEAGCGIVPARMMD